MAAEFVQQLGLDVVLTYILPFAQHARRRLHGTHVRLGGDGAGAADDAGFVRILDQAHFIEQRAGIALHGRKHHPVAHAGAHLSQPAFHARSQPVVHGKRIQHGAGVLQHPGQALIQLGHRMRGIHPQRGNGRLGAQAVAVPDFAIHVLGLAKQRGAQRARRVGLQHQPGIGLVKAREVIKIAVVTVRKIAVAIARLFGRRGNHRNGVGTHLPGKGRTAASIRRGNVGKGSHKIGERKYTAAKAQPCENANGMPSMILAHPNPRGSTGYGLLQSR